MTNGFITVNEKDWEKNTPEQRDWLIFNTLQSMNDRLKTLEKRPIADKCFALAGGIIGGFAAALGLKWGA